MRLRLLRLMILTTTTQKNLMTQKVLHLPRNAMEVFVTFHTIPEE
jgi:hypothetical protein